jgi:hypothetical protein
MKFLALSFILLCAPGALLDFAVKQWKADPAVEMQDAYKWLFQATRGGEHAVPSEDMAREWLEGEWKALGMPQEKEASWQPLCSDKRDNNIGRLNLRVFKARGGEINDVLTAFVESSKKFDQSKENFITAWNELGKRVKKKPQGKLTRAEWEKVDTEMKAKDYPAIHHSKNYEDARHPAYRIVTADEYKKLVLELKKK